MFAGLKVEGTLCKFATEEVSEVRWDTFSIMAEVQGLFLLSNLLVTIPFIHSFIHFVEYVIFRKVLHMTTLFHAECPKLL